MKMICKQLCEVVLKSSKPHRERKVSVNIFVVATHYHF